MRKRMVVAVLAVVALSLVALEGSQAAYAPGDNGRIAFRDWAAPGGAGIFTMQADGSDVRRVTSTLGDHANFSPDGSRIVFAEWSSSYDVWVVDVAADGSGAGAPIRLTTDKGKVKESFTAWSPDGSKIAFAGDEAGQSDLWVMNADGSGRAKLTNTKNASEVAPAWSPDGSRIAFVSRTGGGANDVFTMPSGGGAATNLTNTPGVTEWYPDYSPSGSKILFGRENQIFVMNVDGTAQTQLTKLDVSQGAANWSPDGTKIVFNVIDANGRRQTAIMPASGESPPAIVRTQITDRSGGAWWPDWQRLEPPTPTPTATPTPPGGCVLVPPICP